MDSQLSSLYNQIKNREISREDAVKQFKEYKIQRSKTPFLREIEYETAPEVYRYDEPFLRDHRVQNEQVLSGMTYASLAINFFFKIFPQESGVHLHRLSFIKPVVIGKDQRLEVLVKPTKKENVIDFQVAYRYAATAAWNLTATGSLRRTAFTDKKVDVNNMEYSREYSDLNQIYTGNPAVELGDSFKTITRLYKERGQVLARVDLRPVLRNENHQYLLHPLIINSAFLAIAPLIEQEYVHGVLPFGIEDVYFYNSKGLDCCWLLVKLIKNSGELVVFDAEAINDESQVVARFSGCSWKRLRIDGQIPDKAVTAADFIEARHLDSANLEFAAKNLAGNIQTYLTNKLTKIAHARAKLANLELNLMDQGFESSQLAAMANEIAGETNIELNPTIFFEYPSIKELTAYFSREHKDSFVKLLSINTQQAPVPDGCYQSMSCKQANIKQEILPQNSVDFSISNKHSDTETTKDDIAIIGMHGSFAEAANLEQFWENLREKKDVIKEVPLDHWDYRPWYDRNPTAKDKTYCKWGSFIDDVDKFDAGFFNMSPREAEWIDPQLRLLLQSIYAAGEDAGYINQLRKTNTGVFMGVCFHDYMDRLIGMNLPVDPYILTGNAQTVIANRISFLFDLTGPSIAVDTACSSSLVALHYACLALRNKECDMAFVGGANLLLSSFHYRYFCSIGALSPTGRCHTFDEAADGYVPGECIASILLKPLSQAEKDGDHIYAVVKGSAALHGGYTPSLTAPSVAGEENVILRAWEDAGVNPETLSYIEAHGTGTKLGDPIEISGLKKAFQRFTNKEQFCAVGSVKANIGHAEGAAGIAGLLKVILQMKHKKIVAMPQFKKLNPYIQLDKSALYINQEIEEWQGSAGNPRRAGISSFGFSGAYAHAVIEEYIDNDRQPLIAITSQNPAVIVLSAKNKKQLRQMAGRLLATIKDQKLTDDCLADMAYTLQVGREAMEERLAMLVSSVGELEEKLKGFINSHDGLEGVFQGQIKQNKEAVALFTSDEEIQETIHKWIQRGKYSKFLDLWVKGLNVDWSMLYGDSKPRRISLPAYPFVGESYWIPENKPKPVNSTAITVTTASEHPLLHHNTSNLWEQKFSSTFTGQEFFLNDHMVKGQRIMPGVAYLEMARAAVERAAGAFEEGQTMIRLENVIWTQPIVVEDQPVQVHIGLFPGNNDEINFEIYSDPAADNIEPVMHSQGVAVLSSIEEEKNIDIELLRAECLQNKLNSRQCYEAFQAVGLNLGQGFQGVKEIYGGNGQALGKLTLPSVIHDTQQAFILHPSLMDSALHVCIALMTGAADMAPLSRIVLSKLPIPFALKKLEIIGKCTSTMWSFVRYSEDSEIRDKIQKFDIDLCDEQGRICVRMKGFSFRVLEGDLSSAGLMPTSGILLLEPSWREQSIVEGTLAPGYAKNLIVLCEQDGVTRESIEDKINGVHCLVLDSRPQDIAKRFEFYANQVFTEIQGIFKEKKPGRALVQIVVPIQKEQYLFTGLYGLLKTAALENSKFIGQLIEVEQGEALEGIIEKIKSNSQNPGNDRIRYQDGKRLVAVLSEVGHSKQKVKIPWKDGGIYLITGGAGGLGLIFAKEIMRHVDEAILVLTGRTALNEDKKIKLQELQSLGAKVTYRQVDVTKKKEIVDLIQSILEDYGGLQGIIHGAGVIRDNFILNKTRQELQEVLAPKVTGLVELDEATRELDLDFCILFSSMAGILGNTGQADYTAANAFMNAYAEYRNNLVALKERQGHTLSINWPLWKDGGMHINKATEQMMRQNIGMIPMRTQTGIDALYKGLAVGKDQIMIVEGDLVRMKQKLLPVTDDIYKQSKKVSLEFNSEAGTDLVSITDKVQLVLMQTIAKLLKVRLEDINIDVEFSEYGFDSITFTEFANTLNTEYQMELVPTVFFDYSNLRNLAAYLIEEHQTLIAGQFMDRIRTENRTQSVEKEIKEVPAARRQRSRFANPVSPTVKPDTNLSGPIAIVGVSGIFPMARNLSEFWRNLVEEKDCITEIPKARWDWREYYGNPGIDANKTNVKWGAFIEGVDEFDPLFFGISPREAQLMDPQQRLLMTYVWKVIEDAGYSAQSIAGSQMGLFVATGNSGYSGLISQAKVTIEGYTSTGMVPSVGPNRMSYFLNIHGPSEPIETACSSSLVAIHRAVNAINDGSCEMAITGGINTIITPDLHISFSKAGMLCEDGHCKTFSDKANGYVRGEGVGMLFLKKLKDAESAGDHIYGVIRGTAENHGGRANSLTAPNPKAQADLLKTAYSKAGIDPRTVTYIEAHGTGTELGDPIEINALKAAFKDLYQATGDPQIVNHQCGLGSVKTNIGHLELAAGVAGVIKVLLQLKHEVLVKSLYSETINPYIQLKDSPFYIVQETKKWKALQDKEGTYLPRRAGVSSFGFGGANSHVVIEEYIDKVSYRPQITVSRERPSIIVLSAKNQELLKEQVRNLLTAVREEQYADSELPDVAYTLQVGREAMEERLGLIVESVKELVEKLQDFVENQESSGRLYRGQVMRNKETLAVFSADEDMANIINAWINKEKYGKILDLWSKGLDFDWNQIYGGSKPRRINLPTYPFLREHYWVPKVDDNSGGKIIQGKTNAIHPLLHQNTSDFSEQRFSSIFTGQEFFLADHIVQEQRILPGMAYIEMARAAVEQSTGVAADVGIQLKNVVWARPVIVGKRPVKVQIGLFPEDNGEIAYEISSISDDIGKDPVVHSQGSAILHTGRAVPALNIKALLAECSQRSLTSGQCYEAFGALGIKYGPGHQGIEKVYIGRQQVLAKLSLPPSVSDTWEQFILHPSLMDGALQASLCLGMAVDDKDNMMHFKLSLPFALQELEVFKKCTSSMWALVRYSDNSKAEDMVRKLDIDLCDEQGNVCVQIRGFSSRVVEGDEGSADSPANIETMLFEPCWREEFVSSAVADTDFVQHLVILCEADKLSRDRIEEHITGANCLSLNCQHSSIEDRFGTYATQIFEEIQRLLKDNSKGRILVQIVFFGQEEQHLFSGYSGILNTARLENPKFIGQIVEVEPGENTDGVIEKLKENSRCPFDNRIRYQDGKRMVAVWREVNTSPAKIKIPWKDRGVYLISGGAGGLGHIFVEEIARQVKEATLILIGRSPLSGIKEAQLKGLRDMGVRIIYKQVDVVDREAVTGLIQNIQVDFGKLDGIIHAAGVIRDNFILKKNKEELQEVLAPKVTGLVNMDQATKDLPLDFFIFFSSGAAALGSIGQADYSAANAFMDAFAEYRSTLLALKQRYGQALSINWPLWQDGGMRIDEASEQAMRENLGMVTMRKSTGIKALYQSLAAGNARIMVVEGNRSRFCELLERPSSLEVAKAFSTNEKDKRETIIDQDMLRDKTTNYFKKLLSVVAKLPVHRIDADVPLERYGMDSIMVLQMTNQLEKIFGSLSKTLFFEYQNLLELTEYFLQDHRDRLTELLGIDDQAAATSSKAEVPVAVTAEVKPGLKRSRYPRFALQHNEPQTKKERGTSDIAIIGVSGRYPLSGNVQEFWQNLRDGRDCITEIPRDRWDYNLYFDEDKTRPGKTYSKWGGFLEGVDRFDPLFFNISPREAKNIDPQERLFLECVYETLEDAGYTREDLGRQQGYGLGGNVGVYVGVMYEEYQLYGAQEQICGRPIALPGNPASIANRISYFCNFHGPSMAIDTMCSSSLTAIHLACQSLRQGGCELAIAGGVNVSIHPNKYLFLAQGRFISSNGRCETFGQGGDGYVPGEGVGAILLKPLTKAIADGDHIYGVIKATAVNHGGRTNGFTVPNPNAQASVIGQALREAGIDPRSISYVEAHGTGTSLGDPIEITGLCKAFQEYTRDKKFCAIGSVKSNIGHCESAAGIAGITKVLLQLKYRQLVPSLHSEILNPNIDFSNTPFVVQHELAEWKRPVVQVNGETKEYARIAGISSFGAGGSNAHVVIEEYFPGDQKQQQIMVTSQKPAIIVLSAKDEERLKEQASRLLAVIAERQDDEINLADMAYTLQVGREAMEERLGIIVKSIEELKIKLQDFLAGCECIEDLYRGQVKRNKETLMVFATDEDSQNAIYTWIAKGKYARLLDLWVKGLSFDWNKLYGDIKPRRISLPTYPFDRQRYWAPEVGNKPGVNGAAEPSAVTAAVHTLPLSGGIITSKISNKPSGISLPILSDERTQSVKTADQSHLAALAPPSVSLLRPRNNNEVSTNHSDEIISREELQEELAISLAEALYTEPGNVDIDKQFIELGLDSIIGVEWIKKINKKYGTSILAIKIYDYPSIREFAAFLARELKQHGSRNISSPENSIQNTRSAENTVQAVNLPSTEPIISSKISITEPGKTQDRVSLSKSEMSVDTIQKELAASLADTLYMQRSEVDVDKEFVDLGLDSITGVEWIKMVNKQYGMAILATQVYDYPNVRKFARFIGEELKKSLNYKPDKAASSLSLDDILQQVRQGAISIEQADQLLHQVKNDQQKG